MKKIYPKSGRADLNRRPLGPEPSALAGLSHAPYTSPPLYCFQISLYPACLNQLQPPTLAPKAPRSSRVPPSAGSSKLQPLVPPRLVGSFGTEPRPVLQPSPPWSNGSKCTKNNETMEQNQGRFIFKNTRQSSLPLLQSLCAHPSETNVSVCPFGTMLTAVSRTVLSFA